MFNKDISPHGFKYSKSWRETDFRSVLGALQWLTIQTRGDIAFSVNQLQKQVNHLQVKDLEVANQVVRQVKRNHVELHFRNLGKDVSVVCWHDASLYNSVGVEIEDDNDDLLQTFLDKKLIYSQKGAIVGFVRTPDLEKTDPVGANFIGWRSKTNKRIVESSFSAETHSAVMGHGVGHHVIHCMLFATRYEAVEVQCRYKMPLYDMPISQ